MDANTAAPTVAGPPAEADFPAGGGEMGALIRARDWSKTPLGPIESWPPSLRTTASIMLANRFPHLLWWGPDYVQLYNDPYRPVLGTKHPKSMGQTGPECWPEIWHVIGPLVDTPFNGGPATWMEDIFLEINRHGFVEECHFTIAYSPVPDESAPRGIGGVLATVNEITEKVVGERRITILRDLGARAAEAKTAEESCAIAAEALSKHARDVPFALLYLIDPDGRRARLAGAAGVGVGEPVSPAVVGLDDDIADPSAWPLSEAVKTETLQVVENLGARLPATPPGPWSDPPHTAVVVPIKSNVAHQLAGMLVIGVSSRLRLDDLYCSFLELAATQIATAVANARAYDEERKRAEALAEIDRAKTLFFSNVSHEFRTPLTLMLGPLGDIKAGGRLPTDERAHIEVAHRNGLRLLKLVDTLLDFSRIEAGRAQASYEPTDLAAFTAELASNFRSACEKAGLELAVDCPPLPQPIHVDPDMWEKIVLNLLSNAFKFTHQGEIAVALRRAGEAVELAVRDTGVGIPADQLPRIFERFHRVEGARGRTYEGSGIGLALVRELVTLHGGAVRVNSVPDRGTTFIVSIPAGSAHLPADRIGAARTLASTALGASAFVEEALRWLPDGDPGGIGAAPPAGIEATAPMRPSDAAPAAGGAPARILWADDNADMRDYVRRLLSGRYAVEAVADGAAALAAARARPPDLVLADVMMPKLDGFGLLRELRADPLTRSLPVILLSARAGEEARVEGLEAGASDYLIKPFSARELLARVDAQLNMARLSHAAQRELAERLRAEEALRDALQEKDVLLRELQHRTKNNLQVIMSLLNLKAREAPDGAVRRDLEEVRRRVDTLALVHEQLLRARSADRIELSAYIRELCTRLLDFAERDPKRITLALRLDEVAVPPDKAVPLGLIVNEIVSNSLEHAFPGGHGAVQVSLSRAGDGRAALVIADDGPGLPPDAKAGLGHGLIRGLTRQIDAEMAVETERGTRYTLTFPA